MAFIPKVTCYQCKVPLKIEKNGVTVQMNAKFGPYYKVEADVWRCPGCGLQVITGYASGPIVMNHNEGFANVEVDEEVNLATSTA